jgi:hypothetical protein
MENVVFGTPFVYTCGPHASAWFDRFYSYLVFRKLSTVRSLWVSAHSRHPSRGGVTSSSQIPPLVEKETPFQNTKSLGNKQKIRSCVPTGAETKTDCADEGRQQFTRPEWQTFAPIFFHCHIPLLSSSFFTIIFFLILLYNTVPLFLVFHHDIRHLIFIISLCIII